MAANFEIRTREVNDVTIIDLDGRFTVGNTGDISFRKTVSDNLNSGHKKIVVEMSGLALIDSTGIGELVSSYTTVTNADGKLVLVNVPARVMSILKITQLHTVFTILDDLEAAFNAVSE